MPERTLPDALHPRQEDAADELQLRGGLKGRFFADFCLLQSTVDALQNYLAHAAAPDVQDMSAPMLEEMKQRIYRLERLADNAADLVAQAQPPEQVNRTVQEMTVFLAQLCEAANHELEGRAVTGRVQLLPAPQNQPVWAQIDLAMVQTLFANLFSNSLRANPAASIKVSCAGRTLEYRDGRIWPESACAQLAGVQTPEALANGCTGLLLVYRCAQNLGWRLETATSQETVLRMILPPEPLAAFGTHNVLRAPRPESGVARLREEFRATLPPKKNLILPPEQQKNGGARTRTKGSNPSNKHD